MKGRSRPVQLVKKVFLTSWWTGEPAPPPRPPLPVSAKILRISGRGNCKEAIFALENGIFRRGVLRAHAPPQFSMVVPLRSQARLRHSLLHWAYYGLFRALRAAFVRPRRTRRRGRLKCERALPLSLVLRQSVFPGRRIRPGKFSAIFREPLGGKRAFP